MEIMETFLALPECLGRDVDFQSREQLRNSDVDEHGRPPECLLH